MAQSVADAVTERWMSARLGLRALHGGDDVREGGGFAGGGDGA